MLKKATGLKKLYAYKSHKLKKAIWLKNLAFFKDQLFFCREVIE